MRTPKVNVGDVISYNEWRNGPDCFLKGTVTGIEKTDDGDFVWFFSTKPDPNSGRHFEHFCWYDEKSKTWQSGDL